MPWPSANRAPGSSQAAPEANRSLAGRAHARPFHRKPARSPPASSTVLAALVRVFPVELFRLHKLLQRLVDALRGLRTEEYQRHVTTHCRVSAKGRKMAPKCKAKRKFYVKRNFFIMVFSFTHVHTKLLPSPPPVKKKNAGDSLVVQWLGLRAFTAKGLGSILGQGTEIPQAAQCGQSKKNRGCPLQHYLW